MVAARNSKRTRKQFDSDFPVLIVEDQKSIAQLLSQYFQSELGCEVDIAYCYADLVELLKNGKKYGFAVCDLELPDDSEGYSAKLLKSNKIPFCVASGAFGEDIRDMVYDLGAIDYFTKVGNVWISDILYLIKRTNRNSLVKVLVVDDQKTQRMIQSSRLNAFNLNVLDAEDGTVALDVLRAHPEIALVLTDFEMPKLNGTELVGEIRKQYAKDELAIIGITGAEDLRVVAKFLKAGANDCMKKNVSNEELLCRLNQHLEVLELTKAHKDSAIKDFLTGMYNRRYFFTEGLNFYTKHKNVNKLDELSAAIIDIDFFKKINDTYGHEVGDDVLIYLGSMFREYFKEHICARLGGEEFGILFNGSKVEMYGLLNNFRSAVENSEIMLLSKPGSTLKITISGGIVGGESNSYDELFNRADELLYSAKESGRNKIVID